MTAMKPYELRLAQEHVRAARHLRNLRLFIDDAARFNKLDQLQRSLMLEQSDVLSRYVDILEQRMTLLNIPV